MSSNSDYRHCVPKAIHALVERLPQDYVATHHTQMLGQYNRSRHPHVSLIRWLIELPDGPGIYRICAAWFWMIEPGSIQVNTGGLPLNFGWGFSQPRGLRGAVMWGTSYNAVMSILDSCITVSMHQDPLFNDQRFAPQVIETFSARFVGASTSIRYSIDNLISIIIIVASLRYTAVHNLTMDCLRYTLLHHNVWLSALQIQRILDQVPKALSSRRLCSAQVRFLCIQGSQQSHFGGLSPFLQQILGLDPRLIGPTSIPSPKYPACWFHLH